jgi:hypothetical protein
VWPRAHACATCTLQGKTLASNQQYSPHCTFAIVLVALPPLPPPLLWALHMGPSPSLRVLVQGRGARLAAGGLRVLLQRARLFLDPRREDRGRLGGERPPTEKERSHHATPPVVFWRSGCSGHGRRNKLRGGVACATPKKQKATPGGEREREASHRRENWHTTILSFPCINTCDAR